MIIVYCLILATGLPDSITVLCVFIFMSWELILNSVCPFSKGEFLPCCFLEILYQLFMF